MIVFLVTLALLVVGIVLAVCFRDCYGGIEEPLWTAGVIIAPLAGAILIFMVIAILVAPPCAKAIAVEYSAFQATMDLARSTPETSEFELAALTQKAGEMNATLAEKQFWAKNPLTNWFYSKIILEIKPIR